MTKKRKIVLNEVTALSKLLAMALFILLPFVAFVLGMKFQKMLLGFN